MLKLLGSLWHEEDSEEEKKMMEVGKVLIDHSLNNNNSNNIKTTKKRDDDDEEEEKEVQLPGFRFHPTDEELVGFYLKRKVEKKAIFIDHLIKHVDIYKYDPWDLPRAGTGGEKEWYFFCRRGRKYKNSVRPNRVTGSGFWKATGIDKPIYSLLGFHECIGLKKSLVYYRGNASKGTKTDWMMHEFRLPPAGNVSIDAQIITSNIQQEAEVWTLCRIFKREVSYRQKTSASKAEGLKFLQQKDNDMSYEVLQAAMEADQFIYGRDNSLAIAADDQFPLMASHLMSFSNLREENWDELRPMVDFALDDRYN